MSHDAQDLVVKGEAQLKGAELMRVIDEDVQREELAHLNLKAALHAAEGGAGVAVANKVEAQIGRRLSAAGARAQEKAGRQGQGEQ
jgi:hypothetical protein